MLWPVSNLRGDSQAAENGRGRGTRRPWFRVVDHQFLAPHYLVPRRSAVPRTPFLRIRDDGSPDGPDQAIGAGWVDVCTVGDVPWWSALAGTGPEGVPVTHVPGAAR